MRRLLFIGFSVLTGISSQAQKVGEKVERLKGMHPQYLSFEEKDAPSFQKGVILTTDSKNRVVRESNVTFLESTADKVGFTHYRYQQTFNGVPVEDAIYIVHEKAGKVMGENGRWIKDFPQKINTSAVVSESGALNSALRSVNAKTYKWQDADEEAMLRTESNNPKATFYPKGKLVYFSGDDEVTPENLKLAYKFDVYATEPLVHQYIYVDAGTGKVLGTKDLIHTVDGIAQTGYSGTRTIQTTKSGANYILREATRGLGIVTLNMKKTKNYNTAVDFTDADNTWNNVNAALDQYATDAHWGAEVTYDFYKTNFNRNSIDNAGFAIKSYVHYSKNYFNAFWDGTKMTYGDGDASDGNKPLTALDVCGHEITHGLTSFTANLNYKNESGAMNEGFSDIFGTCIEFFARPTNADWLIGADFLTIRDMSNPNAFSQPDTYKGKYWAKGLAAFLDNGGVHTNSGILNFWFYLLSVGGSGVNDNSLAYSVSGISIAKAQAIAYRTLTNYLVPTSVYKDARTYSIAAATDLYGASSNEVAQVKKAWDAVGVLSTTARISSETITSTAPATLGIGSVSMTRQYPNPVRNQFVLEFTSSKTTTTNVTLYNMSGARVYTQNISTTKGFNNTNIVLPKLASGTYVVKMNNEKVSTIQVAN